MRSLTLSIGIALATLCLMLVPLAQTTAHPFDPLVSITTVDHNTQVFSVDLQSATVPTPGNAAISDQSGFASLAPSAPRTLEVVPTGYGEPRAGLSTTSNLTAATRAAGRRHA